MISVAFGADGVLTTQVESGGKGGKQEEATGSKNHQSEIF